MCVCVCVCVCVCACVRACVCVSDHEVDVTVRLPPKNKLDAIGTKLDKAYQSQLFFKARESRHKHTVDSNYNRVQWMSILVCCVMVAVGIIQVVLIRNLFRTTRKDKIRT